MQNTINNPALLSASPGFVRPSRGASSASQFSVNRHLKFCFLFGTNVMVILSFTGFGSALNIETLVAAAEKRDAPIEVPHGPHSLCYLLNVVINSSSLDEF